MEILRHIAELGELTEERQLHIASRSGAMLANNNFGDTLFGVL
jgi:hypothetical protein